MSVRKEELKIAYWQECERQQHPYEQWILLNEEKNVEEEEPRCHVFCYEKLFIEQEQIIQKLSEEETDGDFVVLISQNGEIASFAKRAVKEFFETHQKMDVVYADEDEIVDGKRCNPWFKPEWSPDTLRSFFYFGHIMAIRKGLFLTEMKKMTENLPVETLIRNLLAPKGMIAGHINQILFHYVGLKPTENIRHSVESVQKKNRIEEKVSVIIPSKDHPELLLQCIQSINEKTAYRNYEIIVVDNGSTDENKEKIQEMLKKYHAIYLYEERNFNFSAMCNAGARASWGRILLFLNDDIEIMIPEWMEIMAGQALLPHAGAVGAKLYYPNSKTIQHAGITNMLVGPAHKMGGMPDEGSIYHARNLADYNVIAVTGACLAVDKQKFEAVGGFAEELPVAYNDVDLCFSLWEQGWYNVVRNDVTLYHHESVSRGTDENEEKKERLIQERRLLYQRHPDLYGKDPFYSTHLVQNRLDTDFHIEYQYDYEKQDLMSSVGIIQCPKESREQRWRHLLHRGQDVLYHIDRIEKKCLDFLKGEDTYTEIEGWMGYTREPNYRKERVLLLKDASTQCYTVSVFAKERPDTKTVFLKQEYYELCGFVARIQSGELPKGTYELGIMMTDRCNGRRMVKYLDRTIEI